MATLTASNGVKYHLWGLDYYINVMPLTDAHEIDTIDVDLGDGYRSSIQTGFNAGTRTWTVTFPQLPSLEMMPNTIEDVNGAMVSREQYVRAIFAETKVTGKPFILNWRGVNYFVIFADRTLSMQRMRVKIYSTGIKLMQVRLRGVSLP